MGYLLPAEYVQYGLTAETADDWVTMASALMDAHCRRPSLMVTQYTERLRLTTGAQTARLSYRPLAPAADATSPLVSTRVRYGRPRRGELVDPYREQIAWAFSVPGSWNALDLASVDVNQAAGELTFPDNFLGLNYNEVEVTYTSGLTTIPDALRTGVPAVVQMQVRTEIEATVSLEFESWGKLQMALAAGSQQMNLLSTVGDAAGNGSGGIAAAATPLLAGSTANSLNVGAAASQFSVGDLIVVDVDYTGQLGFVGSGTSGAYVASAAAVNGDIDYVRRVSLNVARVIGIADGALQLGGALLAGVPAAGMQVNRLLGFVDREGGSWFHEWSGLFVMDGEQGDRVIYYYPRLQPMQGATESVTALAGPLEQVKLAGAFRALPVKDANDGETALCFRSYLPGPMRSV